MEDSDWQEDSKATEKFCDTHTVTRKRPKAQKSFKVNNESERILIYFNCGEAK